MSLLGDEITKGQGRVSCSYPGPAIAIPQQVFDDRDFRSELANFLFHVNMDSDRSTTRLITELLTGILRAVGHQADVHRFKKNVGDEVVYPSGRSWRRSPVWLVTRVAMQTMLQYHRHGFQVYKSFLLFFMYQLTLEAWSNEASSEVLHAMSAKLSRRLWKLDNSGIPVPPWLSHAVLQTCSRVRLVVERRRQGVQPPQIAWEPFQLDSMADTRLSMQSTRAYIEALLEAHDSVHSQRESFKFPGPYLCLKDFLSRPRLLNPEDAVSCFQFERAVKEEIADWPSGVSNADDASVDLMVLMDTYRQVVESAQRHDHESHCYLTLIELWIALDKVVVERMPMLADYSPEIPLAFLQRLQFWTPQNLKRLRVAYQYLHDRHCRAHSGWSVFSSEATADHFAVRYFLKSRLMQSVVAQIDAKVQKEQEQRKKRLDRYYIRADSNWFSRLLWNFKAQIDTKTQAAKELRAECLRKCGQLYREFKGASHAKECADVSSDCHKCNLMKEIGSTLVEAHWQLLEGQTLLSRIVVFELHCPLLFDIWRNAIICVCSAAQVGDYPIQARHLFKHAIPRFLPPEGRTGPNFQNLQIQHGGLGFSIKGHILQYTMNPHEEERPIWLAGSTIFSDARPFEHPNPLIGSTSHTSNSVLVANTGTAVDMHASIAFGHFRSGFLLQWFNVLRALRERLVDFNILEIQQLLAWTTGEVGPLFRTDGWLWHQDLEDSTLCDALLAELADLVSDSKSNRQGCMSMAITVLLISRVLAANQSVGIVRRAHRLLLDIREAMFCWVKEISNELDNMPVKNGIKRLLEQRCRIAKICQGAFSAGLLDGYQSFFSAQDWKVYVYCAIIAKSSRTKLDQPSGFNDICNFHMGHEMTKLKIDQYANEGINSAVLMTWGRYCPGSSWERREQGWIACTTFTAPGYRAQQVCLNLIDGELLVDGHPFEEIPPEFTDDEGYCLLFSGVCFALPRDVTC